MPTVLIIEDDDDIRVSIATALRTAGYTAIVSATGRGGLDAIRRGGINLVIMDLVFSDIPGEEIIKLLKSDPTTQHLAIIILSERCAVADRIAGLELGAEDYVSKPFSVRELILRVNIAIRRQHHDNVSLDTIVHGALHIDTAHHRAFIQDTELALTPIEFRLLTILASRPDRVQSRQSLLAEVWGMQSYLETRTVDVHIKRLREKLGPCAGFVRTVRGLGYRFTKELSATGPQSAAS